MNKHLDLYLNFDAHFFSSQREKTAEDYKTFLTENRDAINSILEDPTAQLQNHTIYRDLETLENQEYTHSSMIVKPRSIGGHQTVTINDLTQKAGVSLQASQQKYLDARIGWHLARFFFPEKYGEVFHLFRGITQKPTNTFCENFGIDLIRYISHLPEEIRGEEKLESEKFQTVIGSEGPCVFLFWSLVPYIHLNLKERRLSSEQSIGKIIDWTVSAYKEGWDPKELKLDYLSLLKEHLSTRSATLGYDERMPTHLRRRLLSRLIA